MPAKTIAQSFADQKKCGIGLVPFIPAGFPDLATTTAVVQAVDAAGAAAIEIGFPFSDPIADGPVIQAAFTAALSKKLTVGQIFQAMKGIHSGLSAPLVAMVSYSIVFRTGPQKFFADARAAGFAGVIIPDLPPPEAKKTCDLARAAGLETILLISPTTTPTRRKEIADLCTGFVYYLSITGITGARDELPADLAENVRQIKSLTTLPVCVGFGISKPRHLADLSNIADGAIVGSAIVRRMSDLAGKSLDAIAKSVGDYCRELLSQSR